MKKMICLLLCFALLAAVAACKRQEPPKQTTDPNKETTGQIPESTGASQPTGSTEATGATEATGSPETTKPSLQVPSLPMVSISLPLIQETEKAADGTEIFRYSFQDVSLNITDAAIAQIVTLDLLQRMDAYVQNVADLNEQARQEYVPGQPWDTYYYNILFSPTRIDETLLSMRGVHTSYDGNVRPTSFTTSASYDLITGKYLSVKDILSEESSAAEAMCNALIKRLDKIAKEQELFPDYASTVRSQFSMDLNRHYDWYFTGEGICFYFPPFELAPNSSGTVEVVIPYSELSGALRDDYFPAEQPAIDATVAFQWFDQADLNRFTHFSELLSAPDARRALLFTDTILYNVQLEQGHWDSAANLFIPDATVFAASCIAQDDAVVLCCDLSGGKPTLRLRYTAGGAEQSCYISTNSSGVITLTPAK